MNEKEKRRIRVGDKMFIGRVLIEVGFYFLKTCLLKKLIIDGY